MAGILITLYTSEVERRQRPDFSAPILPRGGA